MTTTSREESERRGVRRRAAVGRGKIAFNARYNALTRSCLGLFSEFRARVLGVRRKPSPYPLNLSKISHDRRTNMLGRNVVHATQLRLAFALVCVLATPAFPYTLPDPTFEVLTPQGLRVSIPGRFLL